MCIEYMVECQACILSLLVSYHCDKILAPRTQAQGMKYMFVVSAFRRIKSAWSTYRDLYSSQLTTNWTTNQPINYSVRAGGLQKLCSLMANKVWLNRVAHLKVARKQKEGGDTERDRERREMKRKERERDHPHSGLLSFYCIWVPCIWDGATNIQGCYSPTWLILSGGVLTEIPRCVLLELIK